MSAVDDIMALAATPDPLRAAPRDLAALQLEAVRERFAERRQQMKILDQRAKDEGITEIRTLADLTPLLFVHTNYKSYPEHFVDQGRWNLMSLWLQTLSARPVEGVDHAGIKDADDWIERLRAAGHFVFSSSGTSGKCSFLNRTDADRNRAQEGHAMALAWSNTVFKPAADRAVFRLFPPYGTHPMCEIARYTSAQIGRPGEIFYMSDEPLAAAVTIRGGQLRRAIAAGTARPAEIAAFQAEEDARKQRVTKSIQKFYDELFARRNEPVYLHGQWGPLYGIVQEGRARGIKDGDWHPDMVISNGGGVKGANLPPDFKEQVQRFFGLKPENWVYNYGMVEMTGSCPWSHAAQGYAIPPWIVPLILDKTGETLIGDTGVVEGRMAFFDLSLEGRWGGLISGDKVTVDFDDRTDGINVPLVRSVARYTELEEGEDKLSCAGTIESYVRGVVVE